MTLQSLNMSRNSSASECIYFCYKVSSAKLRLYICCISSEQESNVRHTRARSQPFRNNNNGVGGNTAMAALKPTSSCLPTGTGTAALLANNLNNNNDCGIGTSGSSNNNHNNNNNNSNLSNSLNNYNNNNNTTNNILASSGSSRTRSLALYSKR